VTAQQYHDGSKHHFHRFAPALGYLDWASQPNPFRSFGVAAIPLPHSLFGVARTTYDSLFRSLPHRSLRRRSATSCVTRSECRRGSVSATHGGRFA